jgi:glycosyltransferase involved in cell wall biosynthesis
LLVVDVGSIDGTLSMVDEYPNVEVIHDKSGTRATARQKGIKAVETEWHLHVDSDVILCKDWFKKAMRYMLPSVGGIWGVAVPMELHIYNITKAMAKLYRKDVKDLLVMQPHLERYLMHDSLLKTEAVKDIKIPPHLHIWEDHYIGKHIVSKGYKWFKVKDPCCLHYVHERRVFEDFVISGMLGRRIKAYETRQILLRLFLSIPKSMWILLATGDTKAARLQLMNYIGLVKGWFIG